MGYLVEECVIIEDSFAGVQAALAGGFKVLGYENKHNKLDFASTNIQTFTDMSTLNTLL